VITVVELILLVFVEGGEVGEVDSVTGGKGREKVSFSSSTFGKFEVSGNEGKTHRRIPPIPPNPFWY